MKRRLRLSKVHLPRRCGSSVAPTTPDQIKTNLALVKSITDRIESLPGMFRRDESQAGEPTRISYYLDSEYLREPAGTEFVLFAIMHPDGRMLVSMPRPELEEIIRSGWGEVRGDRAWTFAPRDTGDLTVLWRIILMAYFDIVERQRARCWETHPQRSRTFQVDGTCVSGHLPSGAFF